MKVISGFLAVSISGLFAVAITVQAQASQEAPPAQNPPAAQNTDNAQTPRRGGERGMGVFGKLTAVHEQSVEITGPNEKPVTVKFTSETRFRKDGKDATLADFKVGDLVFARGQENPDHTWNAELIGERSVGFMGSGPAGGAEGGPRGGPGMMRAMGVLGQHYVFGEVNAVDPPKLAILRPDNVTQTIELSEEASLRKGRESVTMADIENGDHVFVRGAMKDNVFQPATVMVIGPEQWKRMQEMGFGGGPGANPPKVIHPQQKPPEPPH